MTTHVMHVIGGKRLILSMMWRGLCLLTGLNGRLPVLKHRHLPINNRPLLPSLSPGLCSEFFAAFLPACVCVSTHARGLWESHSGMGVIFDTESGTVLTPSGYHWWSLAFRLNRPSISNNPVHIGASSQSAHHRYDDQPSSFEFSHCPLGCSW